MRRHLAPLMMLVALVGLVAAACGGGTSSDVTKVRDPASVSEGKDLYVVLCASCHGVELEGGLPEIPRYWYPASLPWDDQVI